MSGQLVGEVLAASDSLRECGLSERGFHALIAIAEKAHHHTRQGHVRWDHIRAGLYGRSLSTAKRAIAELKSAGLIDVERGWNNQNGRSVAPKYTVTERITQLTQSPPTERLTQGDPFAPDRTGQIKPPNGSNPTTERVTQGEPLDGSIDGSLDGEARCARHRAHPNPPPCHDCKKTREKHDVAVEAKDKAIRAAIDNCNECDRAGRDLYDFTIDCPHHPNFLARSRRTA